MRFSRDFFQWQPCHHQWNCYYLHHCDVHLCAFRTERFYEFIITILSQISKPGYFYFFWVYNTNVGSRNCRWILSREVIQGSPPLCTTLSPVLVFTTLHDQHKITACTFLNQHQFIRIFAEFQIILCTMHATAAFNYLFMMSCSFVQFFWDHKRNIIFYLQRILVMQDATFESISVFHCYWRKFLVQFGSAVGPNNLKYKEIG